MGQGANREGNRNFPFFARAASPAAAGPGASMRDAALEGDGGNLLADVCAQRRLDYFFPECLSLGEKWDACSLKRVEHAVQVF